MKKLINRSMFIVVAAAAMSCVEETLPDIGSREADAISFVIKDFRPADATRSAFDISSMKFQWSENDVIGIFPAEGYQAIFPLKNGEGSNSAVFDGGSWGLKSDAVYYAYYPFNKDNFESENKREQVNYTYEGQEACFPGPSGIVDVSRYDYMASGPSMLEGETVTFGFEHLGVLCGLRFQVPATAEYQKFFISSYEEVFPVSGHFDATKEGVASLVGGPEKKSLFEVFFPAGHQTFNAEDDVELYFLMPPVDLRGHSLKFILYDVDGNYYESDITGLNLEAGFSYGWNAGILKGYDPANCYVISESGTYTIPAVKGNDMLADIGDANSAEVIWETFGNAEVPTRGDLIKSVAYADKTITFTTSDTFKEGNALIAAKDANGTILWSWHIWLTDKPDDQVYLNNAGTMMDRNLGATSAASGEIGALGLMYQWGRKDPFMGGAGISTDEKAASVTALDWSTIPAWDYNTDVINGTVEFSIANPTTFITLYNENSDWLYPGETVSDNTRWQSVKTIYDPCPAGYRVPDGGANGVWAIGLGTEYGFSLSYDNISGGINFGNSNQNYHLTEMQDCWYPGTGMLDSYYGNIYNVGYAGGCWACTTNGHDAHLFYIGSYSEPASSAYRSFGYPVRCMKE